MARKDINQYNYARVPTFTVRLFLCQPLPISPSEFPSCVSLFSALLFIPLISTPLIIYCTCISLVCIWGGGRGSCNKTINHWEKWSPYWIFMLEYNRVYGQIRRFESGSGVSVGVYTFVPINNCFYSNLNLMLLFNFTSFKLNISKY